LRRPCIVLLALLVAVPAVAVDLTFVTYNLLNYPGGTGPLRNPYFRTSLTEMAPDLIVCQEVVGAAGRNGFLDDVLDAIEPGQWASGGFHDGYDSDRALFYRPERFEVLDYGWLDTALRDIDWWQLREVGSGTEFRVFTAHLKASQGSTEEQLRLAEVTILRDFMETLPADLPIIVAGDLNLYESDEPAYQHLTAAGAAQLLDPIDRPGDWHNNSSFADIHTQSTRTEQFGGGATGGMDDRFDHILVTDEWLDGAGAEVLPATYWAYGQDGEHFNQSIIAGGNTAVPFAVANALYQSSDHLPVTVDLHFPDATAVDEPPRLASTLEAWPNPFNPTVTLAVVAPTGADADLAVYDLAGRRVASLWHGTGGHTVQWQPHDLASGVYVARLEVDGQPAARTKLVLMK